MDDKLAAYQPGVCNINKQEINKRRKIGQAGLIVYLVALIAVSLIQVDRFYRLFLFIPAISAATGYLQARNHFCVAYAMTGLQNADETSVEAERVSDKAAKKLDRRKALSINLQASTIAMILTVLALLIPHY